jgi:hypothetical protein
LWAQNRPKINLNSVTIPADNHVARLQLMRCIHYVLQGIGGMVGEIIEGVEDLRR